jgi:hypothetical protein
MSNTARLGFMDGLKEGENAGSFGSTENIIKADI